MAQFDDIDRRILAFLMEDARRSFREIADEVDRSAPTVSNRVERLEELGVIRRFTVDIDRSALSGTNRSLLTVSTAPRTASALGSELADHDAVEHVFRGVGGKVVATVLMSSSDLEYLLSDLSEEFDTADWSVEPLAESKWHPQLGGEDAFGLVCTICGNTISEGGETVEVDSGDRHAVCCSSCATAISEQYERLAAEEETP
ncbi:Lrp/AsnC family transcriptional regulator [Halomarina oriensis]|uniref:AsnC family transcriptional regulator n=1 Tax=Halomarina oriensis TaxID=671145 RepID=A0A6B0GGB6_9EURY|nr:Lrp/AsnC family transcriptional regulator [Halomarina oriensis]MWG33744.1 AsnC family transcriptional regulator [Halomarina oriensis]